ncbi:NNMT/PNMT/TEMT family domain-containing protein [Ditylenchus destructor]|uniref:NNMT/PNMT/TEMT family domain-containing protein n=1 Tax=Ditylenchus destructor TaxID=166010 RepID=A0AAD4R6W3_9BILA|nr:NNMT/PNMT/TEMT family domain-containing protein [Ditylenchus destructor]
METPQQEVTETVRPIEVEILGESFSTKVNLSDEQVLANGHSKKAEEAKSESNDESPPKEALPLYKAKEHDSQFNPSDYLEGFYSTAKEDGAMQMVLFFLPGILYRLPNKVIDLLDLGAGPTVYIPIAVRHRAENIYTSDYAKQNREKLIEWIKNQSNFDWKNVCNWIANIEVRGENPAQMQQIAREKMRAVFKVNVHQDEVIQGVEYVTKPEFRENIPKYFDAVITVFCLEYASETWEEYRKAVKGATSLIKPGGYLIQGGVMEANEYSFGNKRFKCHYLTKEQILERKLYVHR